jgi:hypothetical protein
VQGSAGAKDSREQIVREDRAQRHPTLDVSSQTNFAFDDDESAGLVLRKEVSGEDNVVVCIGFGGHGSAEAEFTTEARESLANLNGENDD